jgi:hypothetical protein
MNGPQTTWLCKEAEPGKGPTTWVLLVYNEDGFVPEWRPVGYVIYRQIYEGTPASWFAYRIGDGRDPSFLGREKELEDARNLVRAEL